MIPENLTYEKLIYDMKNCLQTTGMSVYRHGELVVENYNKILNILNEDKKDNNVRLPNNLKLLLPFLLDSDIIKTYQLFHDCGKPYCLVVDEEGKRHFPNHAIISKMAWEKIYGKDDISELIGMDMDIHLLKNDGIPEFSNRKQWATLVLTGLAEIHANSEMFGGIDSISFKIKYKQIVKRYNAIIKYLDIRIK